MFRSITKLHLPYTQHALAIAKKQYSNNTFRTLLPASILLCLRTLLPHRHLRAGLVLAKGVARLFYSTVHIRLSINLELEAKVRRVYAIVPVSRTASTVVLTTTRRGAARSAVALVGSWVEGVADCGTETGESFAI